MRGSIKRRGNAWRIVVDAGVDATTGRRRQIVRNVRGTKSEAEDRLQALLAEVGAGGVDGHDVTVKVLLDRWLAIANLSVSTRADYTSAIRCHIPATFAAAKVWKVRTHHLDELYTDLRARQLGAARIRRVHSILRRAFGQAVRWQWIARNPAIDASPPSVRRRKPTPPTPEEMRALLAAAGDDFVAYLRLSAALGARRGEVCALQWADIDLDDATVTIERARVDGGRGVGIVTKETKTDRERVVAIDAATAEIVRRHRRQALEEALALGFALAPTGWVFAADAAGITATRPDRMTKRFGMLRAELGLSHVKLRELRHFVATQLLADGVDLRTVSEILGHARTSTTGDLYAAYVPVKGREAADKLGRLLG